MENFTYYAPTRVIFGKGAIENLGKEAEKLEDQKAIIVYGSNRVEKNGILQKVEEQLDTWGIEHIRFAGVKANPTVLHAKEGIKLAKEYSADLILAIGGGSAIDTAKAMAIGAVNSGDIWDIWTGKVPFTECLDVACVLTIPAAGSEMSNSAVLTNEELGQKVGLTTDIYRCKFAIMDPTYAQSLPKKQIACGVVDIMMHTLDRYFNKKEIQHNHMTDAIAHGLLKTVIKWGKIAYDDPSNYEAMSEIMWASSLSHNDITGLGGGRDFSIHQFGHEISAKYDITHGESLSAIWGTWCRYVMDYDIDRFALYAKEVWGSEKEGKEAAIEGIEKTEEFFKSLDMPIRIPELSCGILDKDTLDELAIKCTRNGARKIGTFHPLDTEEVKKVYYLANIV
ncbi:MAG: iron-containing alcohol dehydrogenase [Clostridiales bacterium]|nr:iron-containing alcohol dehydrogenase [Clostridiales bacterium]